MQKPQKVDPFAPGWWLGFTRITWLHQGSFPLRYHLHFGREKAGEIGLVSNLWPDITANLNGEFRRIFVGGEQSARNYRGRIEFADHQTELGAIWHERSAIHIRLDDAREYRWTLGMRQALVNEDGVAVGAFSASPEGRSGEFLIDESRAPLDWIDLTLISIALRCFPSRLGLNTFEGHP